MTKPEANNKANDADGASPRLVRISDDFIAFIYAASVGVFVDKAYDGNLFNYPLLGICVVLSIFFFAQDWLTRFGGFRRVEGVKLVNFYLKSILDVAVVISLGLIILEAIYLMSDAKTLPSIEAANSFFIKISIFAITAGLWNIFVIFTVVAADPRVSRKDIISFLATGHVGDEILDLFPRIHARLKRMETWLADCIGEIEVSSIQLREKRGLLRHFGRVWIALIRIFLRRVFVGPLSLIPFTVICWIGLHLLLLNLFLGFLIIISIQNEGIPLMPVSWWGKLMLIALTLLFWASTYFRTWYFAAEEKKRYREIIGYFLFWAFLLLFYSIWSAQSLVWILVGQQLVTNAFIFSYLLVPARSQGLNPNSGNCDIK